MHFSDPDQSNEIWKDDILVDNDVNNNENNSINDENVEDEEENKDQDVVTEKRLKKTFEFTVKIKGLPYKIKKAQMKEFLKPIKPLSLRFVPKIKGIAYVSFKNEKDLNQIMIKHRGFIDGHRIEIVRMNCDKKSKPDMNNNNNNEIKNNWKDKVINAEPISESGRIYVRNLSYTCTEDDLRVLFEKFGTLTELYLPIDSVTKKQKGFAFVTYMFPEHAIQAFNALDKTDFQGRLIHLLPAESKKYTGPSPALNNKEKMSSFKKSKLDDIKSNKNNPKNWNTLFVRPNAVADIMSQNLNMDKMDLLTKNDKNTNVAVRMALGETQIVNEIKQFLIKNNVNLESFERGFDCIRSRTVILVKNLPAETSYDDIKELFEKFGLIIRIVLPPHGVC